MTQMATEEALRTKAPAPSPAPDPSTTARPSMVEPTKMDWTGKSDEEKVAYIQQWRASRQAERVARDGQAMRDGTDTTKAGELTRHRAIQSGGMLARKGDAAIDTLQTAVDASNSTMGRMGHAGLSAVAGVNTRSAVNNVATLGQLAGHEAIAQDSRIEAGYQSALSQNEAAHGEFTSTMGGGSASAKAKFRAAARLVGKQVKLGVYQDLTKREGADEYSMDETLGSEAKGDYKAGDTIAADDHEQGSLYGNTKRAITTGRFDQRGKLSTSEKEEVAKRQSEVEAIDADKEQRAENKKGSFLGGVKRLVTTGHSGKLTDDEKDQVADLRQQHADLTAAHAAKQSELEEQVKTLQGERDAIYTARRGMKKGSKQREGHRQLQNAKEDELKAAQKALDDHKTSSQAELDALRTKKKDIRANASGELTSEQAARKDTLEKEIGGIRRGATDEQLFAQKHAGKKINAYNRVDNGIIHMLDNPDEMKATTMDSLAQGVHGAGQAATTAGMVVGGNADDAQELMARGDHKLAAATSTIGVGSTLASATGVGHAVTSAQTVVSSGLKTVGAAAQGLTAEAAAEATKKQHAREVHSGARKASLATKSFITLHKRAEDPTFIQGAVAAGKLAAGLGPDAIDAGIDKIKDATGLNAHDEAAPAEGDSTHDVGDHAPDSTPDSTPNLEHAPTPSLTDHAEHVPSVDVSDHAEHAPSVDVSDHAEHVPSVDVSDHAEHAPSVDVSDHADQAPSVVDQVREQAGDKLDEAGDTLKDKLSEGADKFAETTAPLAAKASLPSVNPAPVFGALVGGKTPDPAPQPVKPSPDAPAPAAKKLGWWARFKNWVKGKFSGGKKAPASATPSPSPATASAAPAAKGGSWFSRLFGGGSPAKTTERRRRGVAAP